MLIHYSNLAFKHEKSCIQKGKENLSDTSDISLQAFFILVLNVYAESICKNVFPDYTITAILPYDGGYWFAPDESGTLLYDLESGEWFRYNKENGNMNQSQVVNDMKIMLDKVWFVYMQS